VDVKGASKQTYKPGMQGGQDKQSKSA